MSVNQSRLVTKKIKKFLSLHDSLHLKKHKAVLLLGQGVPGLLCLVFQFTWESGGVRLAMGQA